MPNRKPINTIPLFNMPVDADHAKVLLPKDAKADERKFVTERKRQTRGKKHVPLAKAPAHGPACLRCKSWRAPMDDDEFGECHHLVMTAAEAPWANVAKGTIVDRDTARNDLHVDYDYLRTGEAFSCSAYALAAQEDAA